MWPPRPRCVTFGCRGPTGRCWCRASSGTHLAWLGQESVARSALVAYFGSGPSELRAIMLEAERRVGQPIVRSVGSAGIGLEEKAADEGAETKDGAEAGRSPERVGGEGAGWRWINWLRDGMIAVNAEGAWLHNIGGETYVVVPGGFEAFAAPEGAEANAVKNRVVRASVGTVSVARLPAQRTRSARHARTAGARRAWSSTGSCCGTTARRPKPRGSWAAGGDNGSGPIGRARICGAWVR